MSSILSYPVQDIKTKYYFHDTKCLKMKFSYICDLKEILILIVTVVTRCQSDDYWNLKIDIVLMD